MVAQGHEKEVALGSTGSESAGPLCSANHGMGDQVSQLSATHSVQYPSRHRHTIRVGCYDAQLANEETEVLSRSLICSSSQGSKI